MKLINQKIEQISCGKTFSALLDKSGSLFIAGKLGINTSEFKRSIKDYLTPFYFPIRYQKQIYRVKKISAGYDHLTVFLDKII